MLAAEMQKGLNDQINEEYCGWYLYRLAAAYCRELNLTGFSKWLQHLAKKKLHQVNALSDFVVQRRGHVEARPIEPANGHWESPQAVLDSAWECERHLSQSVAKLSDTSLRHGDHAAHELLERFAAEQAEAESRVERARDRLALMAAAPGGMFLFDRDLA
jgi:ferritin